LAKLLPWLLLKGFSTGNFAPALFALLGSQAAGISPGNIGRLRDSWHDAFGAWNQRPLNDRVYVRMWAATVYLDGADDKRGRPEQGLVLLMGATSDGRKELVALAEGFPASPQPWREMLLDAKRRGLVMPAAVAVESNASACWAAIAAAYPDRPLAVAPEAQTGREAVSGADRAEQGEHLRVRSSADQVEPDERAQPQRRAALKCGDMGCAPLGDV